MNDTIVLCVSLVLVLTALTVSLIWVRNLTTRTLTTISTLAQRSEAERERLLERWAEERKDLLNRVMTKTWAEYAQVSGVTSQLNSESWTPVEADRGTGEILIDLESG